MMHIHRKMWKCCLGVALHQNIFKCFWVTVVCQWCSTQVPCDFCGKM